MSTASYVPETAGIDGERAVQTMRAVHIGRLLLDSFGRLRYADGFSHARALAFQLALTLVPGTIVVVAIASKLQWGSLSDSIVHLTGSIAPGPAGDVFNDAFEQGTALAWSALIVGGLAFVVAGTTAFGQIERAANRIYGIEADRPPLRKYGYALLLMLSAGLIGFVSFAFLGLGEKWFGHGSPTMRAIGEYGRLPVFALLGLCAVSLIFKGCPRRLQPALSWLAFGGVLTIVGTVIASVLLNVYLDASADFGRTYGPLAGFIGVLLWLYLVSIALLFGLAFAAQLEAERAGRLEPRDADKAHDSDPPSQPPTDTGDADDQTSAADPKTPSQVPVGAHSRNDDGWQRKTSFFFLPLTPPSSS